MKYIVIVLTIVVFYSCSKGGDSPSESLLGSWNVTKVIHSTGTRFELGISVDTSITISGDVNDVFDFTAEMVDYRFSTIDSIFILNTNYTFKEEKINSGFSRVPFYSIITDNGFDFECKFGDETKNSHRDATEIRLLNETTEIGPFEQIIIFLKLQ